jgi:hypothetical protein
VSDEIIAMVDEHVAKLRALYAKHLTDMSVMIGKISDLANEAFAQRDAALAEVAALKDEIEYRDQCAMERRNR